MYLYLTHTDAKLRTSFYLRLVGLRVLGRRQVFVSGEYLPAYRLPPVHQVATVATVSSKASHLRPRPGFTGLVRVAPFEH